MFIPKFILETLFSAVAAHREQTALVAQLQGENARLKASCDWLAEHCNQLQRERAVLLDRVLQVQIPIMEIAREERPMPPRLDPELTPEVLKSMAARFAPPPDAERGTVFKPASDGDRVDVAEKEAQAAMSIFEDMGDERAAKAGVSWDEKGELTYSS